MVTQNKRKEKDVMKLMLSDYEVNMFNENSTNEFWVKFFGPSQSPYEGGVWKVHITLMDQYPYKSPSVGFLNKIFHPNIDEASGSVCLDVINQTWSPMFDLKNIFDTFLPQLLLYPNSADPLNAEAAALHSKDQERYEQKVREYVKKYASDPDLLEKGATSHKKVEEDDLSELSETSDLEDSEMDGSEAE